MLVAVSATMDGDQVPAFKSAREEADFYKEQLLKCKTKLRETQLELEEFQASSRDLETELETQLSQLEHSNRELKTVVGKLQSENEGLQEKLSTVQREGARQVSQLQSELDEVTASREDMHRYIRELEQSNDDLERAKRATVASLEEFESKLNHAIERNAFLENELDEKEALGFMVQRLKDETRDLKQELIIHQTVHKEEMTPFPVAGGGSVSHKFEGSSRLRRDSQVTGGSPVSQPRADTAGHTDSNRIATENGATPVKLASNGAAAGGMTGSQTPLTPSARVSALNIVGDLLRKVGFHIIVLRVRLDQQGELVIDHRVRSRPSYLAQFSAT